MEIVLLIAYLLVLGTQIAFLALTVRRPRPQKWIILLLAEALSAAAAYLLGRYFDALPGAGFMPGMTYFAEAISGYAAACAYGFMCICTTAVCLACTLRTKHNP